MHEANKGRVPSEETRAKMRLRQQRLIKDPEWLAKNSAGQKRYWSTKSREEKLRHTENARKKCRKRSDTSIERAVAAVLKEMKIKFVPQYEIDGYSVDFYIPKRNLIIECDGSYWHDQPKRKLHDQERDARLKQLGYLIVHLKDKEINKDAQQAVRSALGTLF